MKKLLINKEECIGCNLCVELCPDEFESTGFVPTPLDKDVTYNKNAHEAVEFCPVNAICII